MKKISDVFWQFLVLGCISFGGPAAHIGYFQKIFVQKLKWLDNKTFANIVALSQFLPGPGSSQVGFSLGYHRAGIGGALAAFIGFTLPSFLLLYFLATSSLSPETNSVFYGVVQGLKLLAVVVVADAVITMFSNFCRKRLTQAIALVACAAMLVFPYISSQVCILLIAGFVGALTSPHNPSQKNTLKSNTPTKQTDSIITKKTKLNKMPAVLFAILFLVFPSLAYNSPLTELFNTFFQAGSWVFGGGHVVLPLLQQLIGDSLSSDQFLLGYASAQAIPGPMFTLATFLGAELLPQQALLSACIATVAIFLPGFLLLLALKDIWQWMTKHPRVSGASQAINASVVGLLMAALYQPVFTGAVTSSMHISVVVLGLLLLRILKLHVLILVTSFALFGGLLSSFGTSI